MGSTDATTKRSTGRGLRAFFWFLGLIFLLFTTSGLVVFLDVGVWLVREDPLQPATVIVVLSGNIPVRALEAAQLYHEGYAKEIWLTHPGERTDPLKELGIAYPAEDDFNIRVLRLQGVPASAIRVLDSSIVNTEEELDAIAAALQNHGGGRVIIVTNKAHTRRVHLIWTKYFGFRGTAIVHGVSGDNFAADQWWRDTGSMHQVVHEVLGIVNAWTGMPVQARSQPQNAYTAEDRAKSDHGGTD